MRSSPLPDPVLPARLPAAMEVFLAFHHHVAEGVRESGEVSFCHYSAGWPAHYHKKWIPLAPTSAEAERRFVESPYWAPGAICILRVVVPQPQWDGWRAEGLVVANPGGRRAGSDYTSTDGHWLYGRGLPDAPDPTFRFSAFVHDWKP